MADFKVGDKVRATRRVAAEVAERSKGMNGGRVHSEDKATAEQRTMTVVAIDNSPVWPIQAMEHPEEYDGDYFNRGIFIFDPDELELVED